VFLLYLFVLFDASVCIADHINSTVYYSLFALVPESLDTV
jgi:hypothetical protein